MFRNTIIWISLSLLVCASVSAQTLDVTLFSQNIALRDSASQGVPPDHQRVATYPTVSEVYQIPCYDLYDRYWDVHNLRSRLLEIPFSDDRLMLILVQSENNPFEIPCVYDEVVMHYGPTKKGHFHPGVDLKVTPQSLVKSCFDGVVRMVADYGDYGLTVVVRHYNGLETVYAHLDKTCVKPGHIVKAGDVIGQAGRSGNAQDDILHFEVRFMNECFDPENVINFEYETLVKNTLVLQSSDFLEVPLDQYSLNSSTPLAPKAAAPKVTPALTEKPKQDETPATVAKPEPVAQPEAKVSEEKRSDTREEPATTPQAVEEAEYYVVKKGEGLYRIALNHKTTIDKLMKLNNISNPDQIREGQRLRVR
ncbi:MAG: peptidoglycan DD-metalloendopeptidase family protein [Bacteroidales bacterium]|nr:peptidoglycan DD-metalloendopeptidase family protein [Bacteroidales bacterium]